MSQIKPRMAVAYHVFNDFDTQPGTTAAIRETYDGQLAIAIDYMVFNVTKDDIQVRMAVHDEDIWQFSRALLSTLLDHGATPANLRQLP